MPTPVLTAEQRHAASERASEARRARAEICAALKRGSIDLPEVFRRADEDDAIAALRVESLLRALPRIGPRRAADAMTRLRIAPGRRVRGLGSGQRARLVDAVRTGVR